MMPVWTYTIKCQSKHYYNFQDTAIEGRQYAIIFFSPLPNCFHFQEDAQVYPKWQPQWWVATLGCFGDAFSSGRRHATLFMSCGDEAHAGSAGRRRKFHLWNRASPEKNAREAEIHFPPTVGLAFLPKPESWVTSPTQEGTCFLQQEKGCLGANQNKWSLLALFLYPLERYHNYNILYVLSILML